MQDGNIREQIPQPYRTNNAALAICLHICGVPFTSFQGIIYPGFNLYSKAFLAEKGCSGMNLEAAVKHLFERGIPGQIVYQFERVPGMTAIEEISKGWDDMAEAIQRADSADPDASTALPIPATEFATIAAICCQFVKGRKVFFGDKNITPLWRKRDKNGSLFIKPCHAVEGEGRIENNGDAGMIYYGSMKLRSVKL